MNRMGLVLQLLRVLWYANEREYMLNRMVSGNESWVQHYKTESNGFSAMETSKFTLNQKFKVTPSAGKVMLTKFWDSQGVLLAHFQKRG